jgi:NADPH:quinone reductase-like Zn-dependent oxidoreductase
MKAIISSQYGSPDVLQCKEIAKPTPEENRVLVKVHAAAANPLDWHFMRGKPYLVRITSGFAKPKDPRLGADFAGVVEAIGSAVTQFQVGDQVFGSAHGAFAEYVCAREGSIAHKPANMSYEQAAAIPVAALTALQGLRDIGKIQAGQRVLINGAAGGVGTYAVQIAKAMGTHVTGVCSTRNLDTVRSLGADTVIDYTAANFTQSTERYDIVLDCIGNQRLRDVMRVMNRNATYVVVGGPDGNWLGPLAHSLKAVLYSNMVSQNLRMFIASTNQADLLVLKELIEANKLQSVIERCYPLEETAAAIRHLEGGHVRGKLVIRVV